MSTRSPALAGGREAEDDRPAIAPFWHRLNSFFLFPFQMEPLIYAALLALASYLLFLPGIIKFFTVLGLVYSLLLGLGALLALGAVFLG